MYCFLLNRLLTFHWQAFGEYFLKHFLIENDYGIVSENAGYPSPSNPASSPALTACVCVWVGVGVHMRALIRVLLCGPTDCGPQGSCFHGNFQARILQWVLNSSSWPTDWTGVSYISWTGRRVLSTSAIHTVCYWCPNRVGRGKTGTEDHALGKYLSSIYYLYGFLKPFRVALSLSLFF